MSPSAHKNRNGRQVCIPLDAYFNNDGISHCGREGDGDFDGRGMTFPAEELPDSQAAVELFGVDFIFPDKTDCADNNVLFEGQAIPIQPGRFTRLHLLGASDSGSFADEMTFTYGDVGEREVEFGLSDCNLHVIENAKFGERAVLHCTSRHDPLRAEHSKRHFRCCLWMQQLALEPSADLLRLTLPDNPCMHVFAMTLEKSSL